MHIIIDHENNRLPVSDRSKNKVLTDFLVFSKR
jgi:hypothetical protein